MTPIAFALPSSDSAVSHEAQEIYREKVKGLVESPSVGAFTKQAVLAEIQDLASTASFDDWDGDGGLAVGQAAVKNAIRFVLSLPEGVGRPTVVADRDGEIVFDWDVKPEASLSIAVGRDGTISYAGLFGAAKAYGREPLSDAVPASVLFHLRRAC